MFWKILKCLIQHSNFVGENSNNEKSWKVRLIGLLWNPSFADPYAPRSVWLVTQKSFLCYDDIMMVREGKATNKVSSWYRKAQQRRVRTWTRGAWPCSRYKTAKSGKHNGHWRCQEVTLKKISHNRDLGTVVYIVHILQNNDRTTTRGECVSP